MTRTFLRMRTITIRAAIVAVLVAGALAGRPGGLPVAAADAALSISTTPALMPAFDPTITDYTARCGISATIAAPVTVTASAPAGSTVSVAGGVPATGAISTTINRAWNESFAITVQAGTAAPVNYFVRCIPTDMPLVTAIRSGSPGAEYFILSATRPTAGHAVGAYSTRYLQIVNTHGVPVWWYNTGFNVGDAKMLANGNIAWLDGSVADRPAQARRGVTRMPLSGSPLVSLNIPDHPPADAHDFEQLPDGNFLMESYPKVSGVDLTSIGGASDTCILDSEVQEVTPAGQQVWSWFASQHLSPTEINADKQATVALSTCTAPQDAWHLNSIEPFGSDFIASMRFLDAALRINPATGNVVWKLGGTTVPASLTIVGDPLNGVVGQHDARVWPDGSLSMFDNGSDGSDTRPGAGRPARVVRYQIDAVARTATLVQQIQEPLITRASLCCGDARWLPNGNWAIDYGQQGVNAVVTPTGGRALSLNFNDPSTDPASPDPAMYSYRMTPVPPGITIKQLRAAMDVMNLAAPTTPTSLPSGSGAAKVTWKPPARTMATAITGYVVTPYLGLVPQPARVFHSTATSQVITQLRNGQAYQFTVAAMIGATPAATSLKSAGVVVGSPGRPGTPITLRVAGGKLLVGVWKPANNGAKITAYTVTCANAKGGRTRTTASAGSLVAVTGLTKHKIYVCTATATNKWGTGPVSRPSRATPA